MQQLEKLQAQLSDENAKALQKIKLGHTLLQIAANAGVTHELAKLDIIEQDALNNSAQINAKSRAASAAVATAAGVTTASAKVAAFDECAAAYVSSGHGSCADFKIKVERMIEFAVTAAREVKPSQLMLMDGGI